MVSSSAESTLPSGSTPLAFHVKSCSVAFPKDSDGMRCRIVFRYMEQQGASLRFEISVSASPMSRYAMICARKAWFGRKTCEQAASKLLGQGRLLRFTRGLVRQFLSGLGRSAVLLSPTASARRAEASRPAVGMSSSHLAIALRSYV